MLRRFACLLAALVFANCQLASAAPLLPGGVVFGASEYPEITATGIDAYSWFGLNAHVIPDEPANPFGGLTFIYQLDNGDATFPLSTIGRFSIPGLSEFQIEAGYMQFAPTLGVAPAIIDRDPSGDVVGFDYLPLSGFPDTGFLDPGDVSAWMVLYTDAPAYKLGPAFALNNGTRTYQTLVPVPEPSTFALVSVAAVALLANVQRVRRQH